MAFDVTKIIEFIIVLIAIILTYFIVPALKERLALIQDERIRNAVKAAVEAAEQIFGGGTGMKKKSYVLDFITAWLHKHNMTIDDEYLNNLIEGEVLRITNEATSGGNVFVTNYGTDVANKMLTDESQVEGIDGGVDEE